MSVDYNRVELQCIDHLDLNLNLIWTLICWASKIWKPIG